MDASTLNDIRQLTAVNAHGDAYALAANALGLDELTAKFDSINSQHMATGELSFSLYSERTAAYMELMAYAKAHMSKAGYKKFYMLF